MASLKVCRGTLFASRETVKVSRERVATLSRLTFRDSRQGRRVFPKGRSDSILTAPGLKQAGLLSQRTQSVSLEGSIHAEPSNACSLTAGGIVIHELRE